MSRIALGFGASSAATPEEVLALIEKTLARTGKAPSLLATLDRRAALGEVVAHRLGLELQLFTPEALAGVEGVLTYSCRSLAVAKTPSVAEAAALAALAPGAHLLAPRFLGPNSTCAMAIES